MNVPGLSDSVDGIGEHAEPCTSCGGTARLVNGICLACLLHEGLEPEAPHDDESLQSLLARIDVSDCEWRIGNYDILGEIGRGGMGVIYKARHRESRRIVALKRVLSYHSDSTETLIRFRREAEAAASLDHPNILPIYEVGEAEGVPFFTMKFAPGGSLQQAKHVLRDDPRHCVALLARVSRAVHHAHSQGILHRDLKPGNILLDSWREPMVTDFGLAKWLDASSDLTRTLTIFGTPGYIAPEQARGGTHATLGPTADVYSLGAILFDLLAGRPPFLGEHALAVIHEAAEKPAPRLRAVLPSADHDLETICAKCLEREPHARYHSAADLAEDLECWLEGRAIAARPVSLPQHVWRWALRNRVLAGSLTACAFLAAGALTSYMTSSRLAATMRGAELAQRSVTLVPIEDLSEDASGAPGAAALQNEVATALGGTAGINFRPLSQMPRDADPWSADDWRAIGHATGARFALSGSVREREGKLRLACRLIDTTSGNAVASWLDDFAGVGGAAAGVTARLVDFFERKERPGAGPEDAAARSTPGGSTNREAVSYYDRGREFFFRYNLVDQLRAIESFRRAIELDPKYAQAHAMLAWTCQLRALTDTSSAWVEEAERSAEAALRLAPLLADAHRARAGVLQRRGHVRASLDPYLTAYELEPTNARAAATLGHIYDELGRPDLALHWLEKATARDTRPVYADNIGNALTVLGNFREAEQAYRTASIFRPDLSTGALGLVRLALYRGESETARLECIAARAKYERDPLPLRMAALVEFYSRRFPEARTLFEEAAVADPNGGVDFAGSIRFLSARGFLAIAAGEQAEGLALLQRARDLDEKELQSTPDNPTRLYSFAATAAALRDGETACAALEKAIASGWVEHKPLELDPRFDSVRSDPRFVALVTRTRESTQAMAEQVARQRRGSKGAMNPQ